jgi:hypothetical protein
MDNVTLSEILGWKATDLSPEQWTEFEGQPGLAAAREKIEEKGAPGLSQRKRDEILRRTGELLDMSLLDISRRAWNKAQELAKYRNCSEHPSEKPSVVPLADHKITSRHRPYLEVRVNEQLVGRIDFEVQVEVSFKGLRLHVQSGRIKRIDTGECQAEGSLHCEGFLLARQESKKLQLPGTIDLGDGIEI